MSLLKLVKPKNPADFRTRQVRVFKEGDALYISPMGDAISFGEMQSLRRQADSSVIAANIRSNGHLFANLGVSALLTLEIEGNYYLALVRQVRKDFGDSVAKLLSGYIPLHNIKTPILTLEEEVSEEFLPLTREVKIVPCRALPKPYVAEYATDIACEMVCSETYKLPDVIDGKMLVTSPPLRGSPRLYFHAPKNSAQLVFPFHIGFVSNINPFLSPIDDYSGSHGITLSHAEEEKINGKLVPTLHKQGILLAKLHNKKLTGELFTYENGALKPFKEPVLLSEAFAPKDNGIANVNNITLDDYLRMQK